MRLTTGLLDVLNSVELESFLPVKFLAISITLNCIPKHIPKKGISFSLANLMACIFPSTPLYPNPPGIRMPSTFFNSFIS